MSTWQVSTLWSSRHHRFSTVSLSYLRRAADLTGFACLWGKQVIGAHSGRRSHYHDKVFILDTSHCYILCAGGDRFPVHAVRLLLLWCLFLGWMGGSNRKQQGPVSCSRDTHSSRESAIFLFCQSWMNSVMPLPLKPLSSPCSFG